MSKKKTTPVAGMASIAPIINELEKLFAIFNEHLFESALSTAVITMHKKGNSNANGWCTHEKDWEDGKGARYFEINICPEYINRPIEEICATLIHEMCHLYNSLNDVQDCSRSSQHHNIKFKECAEKHGLNVEKHPSRGYASTSLNPETREFIKTLDLTAFDLFRDSKTNKKATKKSSTRKYICPVCGQSIRATKENVNIICGDCNEKMILQ
jgi:predicted SprT family Zn-dependent metalloprotease